MPCHRALGGRQWSAGRVLHAPHLAREPFRSERGEPGRRPGYRPVHAAHGLLARPGQPVRADRRVARVRKLSARIAHNLRQPRACRCRLQCGSRPGERLAGGTRRTARRDARLCPHRDRPFCRGMGRARAAQMGRRGNSQRRAVRAAREPRYQPAVHIGVLRRPLGSLGRAAGRQLVSGQGACFVGATTSAPRRVAWRPGAAHPAQPHIGHGLRLAFSGARRRGHAPGCRAPLREALGGRWRLRGLAQSGGFVLPCHLGSKDRPPPAAVASRVSSIRPYRRVA
jgi:hypothetical protein